MLIALWIEEPVEEEKKMNFWLVRSYSRNRHQFVAVKKSKTGNKIFFSLCALALAGVLGRLILVLFLFSPTLAVWLCGAQKLKNLFCSWNRLFIFHFFFHSNLCFFSSVFFFVIELSSVFFVCLYKHKYFISFFFPIEWCRLSEAKKATYEFIACMHK